MLTVLIRRLTFSPRKKIPLGASFEYFFVGDSFPNSFVIQVRKPDPELVRTYYLANYPATKTSLNNSVLHNSDGSMWRHRGNADHFLLIKKVSVCRRIHFNRVAKGFWKFSPGFLNFFQVFRILEFLPSFFRFSSRFLKDHLFLTIFSSELISIQ